MNIYNINNIKDIFLIRRIIYFYYSSNINYFNHLMML